MKSTGPLDGPTDGSRQDITTSRLRKSHLATGGVSRATPLIATLASPVDLVVGADLTGYAENQRPIEPIAKILVQIRKFSVDE